jgi:hypothetical protein
MCKDMFLVPQLFNIKAQFHVVPSSQPYKIFHLHPIALKCNFQTD